MQIVHLTASTFFGGPERQMLGLAQALPNVTTRFLAFAEQGRYQDLLSQVEAHGFAGRALDHDAPQFRATIRELIDDLRLHGDDVLLCHGYKANLLGRIAARKVGIPVVAVSRGWTGENRKIRFYEWLDRRHLRYMDHVIAVSDGQAQKVRRCRVPIDKCSVIRNAARLHAFASVDESYRQRLRDFFPDANTQTQIVAAAGRLSPEKGFLQFVEAASRIIAQHPQARFIQFGDGIERPLMEQRIKQLGLTNRFVLAGFRADLDAYLPWADVFVLPSYTEGLPNVLLEASAAGVPCVATAVGGSPEVVRDEHTGFLVEPGQPDVIANRVGLLLGNEAMRREFGENAQQFMRDQFTFEAQGRAYLELIQRLTRREVVAC